MGDRCVNHHILAYQFTDVEKTNRLGIDFIEKQIEKAKNLDLNLLISSEMLVEDKVDLEAFKAAFANTDVTVIAYIRNPYDQLLSAYNQTIRDPYVKRTDPIHIGPPPYDITYRDLLLNWMNIGELILCPYDKLQWKNENLISDFLSMLGIESYSSLLDNDHIVNKSFPQHTIEAIRNLNISGLDEKSREKVIDILQSANYSLSKNESHDHDFQISSEKQLHDIFNLYTPYLRTGFNTNYLFKCLGGRRLPLYYYYHPYY